MFFTRKFMEQQGHLNNIEAKIKLLKKERVKRFVPFIIQIARIKCCFSRAVSR